MKVTVVVKIEAADDAPTVAHEVFGLERGPLAPEAPWGSLWTRPRTCSQACKIVSEQVKAAIADQVACPACGAARRHKDARKILVRSLFGALRLASPRRWHCPCSPQESRTFSPLVAVLPERTTPELQYLEAKFAGLASYGLSAKLLAEVLPLGRPLHATAVRLNAQAVAQRIEGERGEERWSFIEGCPRAWEELPHPDLPLVVGLDGGYVHSSEQRSRRDGWFEVVAGKSMPAEGPAKTFGFVQGYDAKPKCRLFEVLASQGMQANQQVTFITDGGEDVRDLPRPSTSSTGSTSPCASRSWPTWPRPCAPRHRTTTCHSPPVDLAANVANELGRRKWLLWQDNVFRALQVTGDLVMDLDVEDPGPEQRKPLKAVTEFDTYIRANARSIPNYGERYRVGEPISSSFVESAVNQVVSKRMVKKQQMRWSPRGAHLLLQVRTRVLNDDLAADFHRWYRASLTPQKRRRWQRNLPRFFPLSPATATVTPRATAA